MDEEADKNNIEHYSTERRGTIVSFSRDKDEISIDEENEKAYLKQYLDESVERFKCCGLCLPIPFERASKKSWWDPRFDSEILEGQYRQTSFSQIRARFVFSLWYMLVISLFWFTYLVIYGIRDKTQKDAFPLGMIFLLFSIFCIINLVFTRSRLYRRYQLPVSIVIAVLMCLLSLASICTSPVLSPAGDFAICIEILIIIYTLIPLPLYLCVILGIIYSITFEIFGSKFHLPVRILSHICVHLIALHILIMTNVRMRGTFMKVGQSLLVRKQLEKEKQLKERMIRSVMPPIAADWLFKEGRGGNHDGSSRPSGGEINFRPFKMTCMKDVSILFADIVGFTRMSSNKTASELVAILNELFERFDKLCSNNRCEKIATLGDCYYCVSGCPTPVADHAICCVQMGLEMIEAIAEFDQERHEDVNMRVGVHTGTVLCGIVGTKRFKFDVWSNDVTLANKMESTGEPGRVHISQVTKDFLHDAYILEPGELYKGEMATYFIVSRKDVLSQPSSNQLTIASPTPTQPGDPSTPFLSFETPVTSNNQSSSLVTAFSQPKSDMSTQSSNIPHKSQLSVNCMVSPFEKLRDSEIYLDDTKVGSRAFSTPSSPTPLQARTSQIIPKFISLKLNDVKATSLPNVFGKDSQGKVRMGLANNVIPIKKATTPSCKYSRLKKTKMELENGKVQQTFKSQSLLSDPLVSEKVSSNHLEVPRDDLSMCQSLNSRKDSGIKSNSRRSSIQQQSFTMNGGLPQGELHTQRVSGYYTSSQSSVNNDSINEKGSKLPPPLAESLLHCQNLRKQSDLQLIKCVQDSKLDSTSINEFPLRPWSLQFKNNEMEIEYREMAHRTSPDEPVNRHTLATAKFNTYFDITISLIVFISISISSFIVFPLSVAWIAGFLILFIIQSIVIFFCIQSSIGKTRQTEPRLTLFLNWYPWHGVGAVLVSLPLVAVLINFDKSIVTKDYVYNYCYLFFVGIVHYCNFTQLNCWMKSSLATIGALIYLLLITVTLLHYPELLNGNSTDISVQNVDLPSPIYNDIREPRQNLSNYLGNIDVKNRISYLNPLRHKRVTPRQYIQRRINSNMNERNVLLNNVHSKSFISQNKLNNVSYTLTNLNSNYSKRQKNNFLFKHPEDKLPFDFNRNVKHYLFKRDVEHSSSAEVSEVTNSSISVDENITKSDSFLIEIYLDVFLLVLLIWVLNREFEISYRLSFHGNAIAAKHKYGVERMKNQVEWLLHNIIPKHVVEQLKNKSVRYSEDVKDAGIIFASVMNFSDMYDESYCNGVECLRVLNELVGDFDELLGQERFSMVEKIKTIGSTFMAASGLNLSERKGNSKEHLFQLMEFALALQGVVDNFNAHLLSFNLELRIGFNFGDVTAGVIGTKKFHYDIWGDAVNIASRMDSTGLKEKIQIPATCLEVLSERYNFEHRGQVYVKGKDLMDVYLYAGRKEQTNTHS